MHYGYLILAAAIFGMTHQTQPKRGFMLYFFIIMLIVGVIVIGHAVYHAEHMQPQD